MRAKPGLVAAPRPRARGHSCDVPMPRRGMTLEHRGSSFWPLSRAFGSPPQGRSPRSPRDYRCPSDDCVFIRSHSARSDSTSWVFLSSATLTVSAYAFNAGGTQERIPPWLRKPRSRHRTDSRESGPPPTSHRRILPCHHFGPVEAGQSSQN